MSEFPFDPQHPRIQPAIDSRPIVVQRRGGVGNQLFQHAVALQLATRTGAPICHLPTDSRLRLDDLQLEDFIGPQSPAHWRDLARFLLPPVGTPGWVTRWNRRLRRRLHIGRIVWREPGAYLEQIERAFLGGGLLLNGYFQDLPWVQDALPDVCVQFMAQRPPQAELRDDVTGLSFRTGMDFRRAGWDLPLVHYDRALEALDPTRTTRLWLIGDDREFLLGIAPRFEQAGWRVEWPEALADHASKDDFWNLARARQLVLSCSTFAWWAAVLGDHLWGVDRHRVACPDPWLPPIRRELCRDHWAKVTR